MASAHSRSGSLDSANHGQPNDSDSDNEYGGVSLSAMDILQSFIDEVQHSSHPQNAGSAVAREANGESTPVPENNGSDDGESRSGSEDEESESGSGESSSVSWDGLVDHPGRASAVTV